MQLLGLYGVTVVMFFALDFLGLRYLVGPLFQRHVGDLLLESFRAGPALVFYLFYVAGLVWFVSWPALRGDGVGAAALNGAILGAIAYGTYEFSNYATLKAWTWQMVATDLAWGTVLTAVSAAAGVAVIRALG
ncbi:DUF2177 family protein [Roseovarius aestuariivivens]|uniref:DUF2177 family protein n=1 Tax=Roseovarius aestuariivivens TaxID=1888910 RepID=UPI001081153F|nr:DUF2177 family protein [Roseovarius aestuariivivens]